MFEQLLIAHCAPTLAGMKAASLFSFYCGGICARCQLKLWDCRLRRFGVRIQALQQVKGRVLVYVYRPKRLYGMFCQPEIAAFLQDYGYHADWNLEMILQHLRTRIEKANGFPHEIGVFLEYPLEDVRGFIVHRGQHCKYCGLWKVYGDLQRAKNLFRQYQTCTQQYLMLFQNGSTVTQLAKAG